MHFAFFAVMAVIVGGFAGVALADEFGERFYNHAPEALGDFTSTHTEMPEIAKDDAMDSLAKDLQDIMPAAGEEEAVSQPKTEIPVE